MWRADSESREMRAGCYGADCQGRRVPRRGVGNESTLGRIRPSGSLTLDPCTTDWRPAPFSDIVHTPIGSGRAPCLHFRPIKHHGERIVAGRAHLV